MRRGQSEVKGGETYRYAKVFGLLASLAFLHRIAFADPPWFRPKLLETAVAAPAIQGRTTGETFRNDPGLKRHQGPSRRTDVRHSESAVETPEKRGKAGEKREQRTAKPEEEGKRAGRQKHETRGVVEDDMKERRKEEEKEEEEGFFYSPLARGLARGSPNASLRQ